MRLSFEIRPGLSPMDRGEVEDEIVGALGDDVDILGGGTLFGDEETVSDFQVEIGEDRPVADVVSACRRAVLPIPFELPTVITLQIGAETVVLRDR